MNEKEYEELKFKFISNAKEFWVQIKQGSSKEANKKVAANDKIVKKLENCGCAIEFLDALLEHESESVRYSAAARLVSKGDHGQAIVVLRELASNPKGLVAVSAMTILRIHNMSLTNH